MFAFVFSCTTRLDRRAEELVAAGVIAVRVGVDDGGDRLVGHGLDAVEDHLSPSGQLRVDDHDAGVGDEDAGVAAAERLRAASGFEPVMT